MKIDWASFKEHWTKPKGKQFPTGSVVWKGYQGSGKTLSLIKYAFDMKKEFPNCKIYSNVILCDIDYTYISNDFILNEALTYQNGADGVLIVLDEAHLYFNKKDGIPLDVLTCISQQRKDRRRLCFTSQIWEELDVSLRKQVKEVVNCKNILKKIQINTVYDGESITYDKMKGEWTANKLRTEIFKHNDKLYNRYDTRQKVIRNTNYQRSIGFSNNVVNFTTPK
jgi:hypothetical protein